MLSDVLDHLSGYQYSYFCETNKYFDNSIEGIGVISKHPILENNALRLSKFKDDRDYRYCLESLIEIKNTRVLFYNTHLTFGKLGQRRQAQEVIDFMKIKEKPQILLGDMNIEKSSNDDIYSGNLSDVWISCHQSQDGSTFPS